MPYITTEKVKEARTAIRKEFPEYKISVRRDHYSEINVTIQSGPLDLTKNSTMGRDYEQVNNFHIKDHYADNPTKRDFLLRVYEIINEGNYIASYDGDYGSIPNFYTNISIGAWDKPYEVKK